MSVFVSVSVPVPVSVCVEMNLLKIIIACFTFLQFALTGTDCLQLNNKDLLF